MVKIRLSEFRSYSPEKKASVFDTFIRSSPSHVETLQKLEAQIAQFEYRYGFSSSTLITQISLGQIRETNEINEWLMLIHLRNGIVERQPASSQSWP